MERWAVSGVARLRAGVTNGGVTRWGDVGWLRMQRGNDVGIELGCSNERAARAAKTSCKREVGCGRTDSANARRGDGLCT